MQQNKEERADRDALKQQINTHPLLALPPEERLGQTRQRMELAELLLRWYRFEQQLEKTLQTQDSALAESEASARGVYTRNKKIQQHFDGVAFMETVVEALKWYDASRGAAFTTYFYGLYQQRAQRSNAREIAIVERQAFGPLKRQDLQLLKQLNKLILRQNLPYAPENLPDKLCVPLAEQLGITPKQLRGLLSTLRMIRLVEPARNEDGEEEAPEEKVADAAEQNPARQIEAIQELAAALDLLAENDQKEYPRLFMTNDVLRPLKDPDGETGDPVVYARVLVQCEEALFRAVFEKAYLRFVYEESPRPDSMRHLVKGRLRRPLQDASIAAYKQVRPSAVSNARKRFQALQKQLRRQLEED